MSIRSVVRSFLYRQNEWHAHGVFLHTVKVTYYAVFKGGFKYLACALLHDVGKPITAFQNPEDIEKDIYSFTDHEERSYQIIKDWPLISDWTKLMVRHHYLIRSMSKEKDRNPDLYVEKRAAWESLPEELKVELAKFLKYDDLGKTVGWSLDKKLVNR